MVMECSKHLDDYQILSEIVSILIPPTALVFKLVVFKLKSRSLLELMKHLDLGEFNYSKELKLLEKEIKFTRLLGNSYQVPFHIHL
ncbi:unnamed protein product [Phaedon cochleariae]|uniref:Uncharacterized protein n=1 Tax=Phaedon cochleariae TaxID=80249 RepID=A0A9N9SFW5_PHACE|nr:unnamed protein product [Phaedon cochleariae]